jgi:hypothetical protein
VRTRPLPTTTTPPPHTPSQLLQASPCGEQLPVDALQVLGCLQCRPLGCCCCHGRKVCVAPLLGCLLGQQRQLPLEARHLCRVLAARVLNRGKQCLGRAPHELLLLLLGGGVADAAAAARGLARRHAAGGRLLIEQAGCLLLL